MDIILPNENGFAVLRKLKEDKQTQDIPVIMLSNLSESYQMDKALDLGAADYIVKANTSLDEIKKVLSKHLVHFAARMNMHKD